MCDAHLDAISCLQSAISKGFLTDALRSLAQLYIDHGFSSQEEADTFLTDILVLGVSSYCIRSNAQGPTI